MADDIQILIVGAGVGGLSLAATLVRTGIEPVVIERAESLASPGGVVELWPDALTMLGWLDVGDAVHDAGTEISAWTRRGTDGTVETRLDSRDGAGFVAVDYRRLRERLHAGLPENTVRTGTALRSIEPGPDRVTVRFENDVREVFDLVIGADGARSDVRRHLHPAPTASCAASCGTASASFSVGPDDATASGLDGAAEIWTTDGVVLTVVPTGDRLAGWVTVPMESRDADCDRSLIDPDRSMIAHGSDAPIDWVPPDVLDAAGFGNDSVDAGAFGERKFGEESVRTASFREDIRLQTPVWAEGRVALVGDAAHARHRLTGCGVTLAVEDAVALASAIRDGTDTLPNGTDPLPVRLDEYASRRAERVGELFRDAERRAPLAGVEPITTDEHTTDGRTTDERANVIDVRSERLHAGFGGRRLRPAVDPP